MASSLAEKNHKPIRKKEGKSKIRKNKNQIQGSKSILRAQNGRKTNCMLAGQSIIKDLLTKEAYCEILSELNDTSCLDTPGT